MKQAQTFGELKVSGYVSRSVKDELRQNLRHALAAGETDGFVKLVFDAKYGELLGAHLIGVMATELISELVVAKKLEATEGARKSPAITMNGVRPAFVRSCLIASDCGSEPRNIDGMIPGAWIAPGPATDTIDL